MVDISTEKTSLDGVLNLRCRVANDLRGRFVKNFRESRFLELGLETRFLEQYVTTSRKNVLRGLHFQTPPHDHVKLVTCLGGEILDVVLDLRLGSPTFRKHELFRLTEDGGSSLYIPKGCAHGFLSLSDHSIVHYQVSTEYAPSHDAGILWSSAGIPWPVTDPVLSDRDRAFPTLDAFRSPF